MDTVDVVVLTKLYANSISFSLLTRILALS